MLRVTIKTEGPVDIWELEGKLSGEWVGELDRLWKARSPRGGVAPEIHLKAVSYVDPEGKQLLTDMRAQGAEIKGCGCMIRAVIEKIMGKKDVQGPSGSSNKSLAVILLAGFLLGGSATLRAQQKPPFAGFVDPIDRPSDAFPCVGSQFGNQFQNGRGYASFLAFGVCIPIRADDVIEEAGGAA
jgi:hypothetical protein